MPIYSIWYAWPWLELRVRHADLVSFTCLKAFAFDQRFVGKDAHDLVCCIEHAEEGLDGAAQMFREALRGRHDESSGVRNVMYVSDTSCGDAGEFVRHSKSSIAKAYTPSSGSNFSASALG